MVSEKLLQTRSRHFLLLFQVVSLTTAGYCFATSRLLPAALLAFSGFIASWIILRLYDATNETIAYFFNAMRNDDTTVQFPPGIRNKTLSSLYKSMNQLNHHFQEMKLRYESNEEYYRTLIRHAASGLLVVNSNNGVELINEAACKYAGISPDSTNPNLLAIKNPPFFEAVCNLQPGEDITYKHILGNSFQLLLFRASLLGRDKHQVKLVSIQDIRQELEARELESYRKLISVMTHEIMNLISPLTSVSRSLHDIFIPGGQVIEPGSVDVSLIKTTVNVIHVIGDQCNGLTTFINNYRKISRIPPPEIAAFDAEEWIEQLRIVYAGKMIESRIGFEIKAEKAVKQIVADKKLLNQVIINLINNACDAVMNAEGERMICMELLHVPRNRIWIKISNNGPYIPPELQEKIFVPFFTTKQEGSGIGLSISQEIMKLHKGSLMVVSKEKGNTVFIIEL